MALFEASRPRRSGIDRQIRGRRSIPALRFLFPVTAFCACLAACFFNAEPSITHPDALSQPGMKWVHSKGRSFSQGSVGAEANPIEGPVVNASFSYDFQLDSTEVTQAVFDSVSGRNPVPANSPFGKGDRYPVSGVSWFDAVLFCNARSRLNGLDTVYAYDWIVRAAGGTVYQLGGLSIHLDRKGFRLPAEAEWEYAAQGNSNTAFPWGEGYDTALAGQYSWFSGNSQSTSHPVAGLKPNAFGLYDMTGNLMEWVNDWKGPYPGGSVTDFAGARDPGPEFDIPVKGGAFKYGLRELRPANRIATYATIPSATSEYVGFRCALGAIAGPRYSSADGQWSTTDKVSLEITRLQGYVGNRPAKLVFINASATQHHLAYVNYSQSTPAVEEFTDVQNAFHPSISPDGKWVAFGTRLEGIPTGSDIYLHALDGGTAPSRLIGPGFIPRWWVEPATSDTFLIYSNSGIDNTNAQWKSTQTLLQKMAGGLPVGAPRTLYGEGGFHDGISSDGRYLATGYRILKMHDMKSGTTRVDFTAPQNGKADGDTSQVCNVSIAPDSTGRTLFLDFGSPTPTRLVGTYYEIHQIAFLGDPEGNVLRWYKAPPQETGWDDLEWSNQPDFAISGATDAEGGKGHLYLLNLKDSVSTRLASGTELMQPALWLGPAISQPPGSGISLDSAGNYDDPATTATRGVFAVKMNLFWRNYKDLRAAFLGSSQMTDGLDPAEITSIKSYNLAFGAGDLMGTDFILRNYLLPNCPNMGLVAISVPLGWFNAPNNDVSWSGSVAGSKGLIYDQDHGFWKTGLPAGFAEVAAAAPHPAYLIDSLGLYQFPSAGWGASVLSEFAGADWDTTDAEFRKNFAFFGRLVADLSARKIHTLFILFPQSRVYKSMHSYSAHGPSWGTAGEILSRFAALQAADPYFHFLDMNQNGSHDYNDSDAFDDMHLSRIGAKKMSARLDPEIRKILAP